MNTSLPSGFKMRPGTLEDVTAAVDLFNCYYHRIKGVERMFTLSSIESEWKTPGFNPETDIRLVVSPRGQLVGYYEFWDLMEPHVRYTAWGCTHPDYCGQGIGTVLLEWIEDRAAQALPLSPQGTRVVVQGYVPSICPAAGELYCQLGYRLIRHNLTMLIDLDETPPVVQLPPGFAIRTAQPGDEEAAIRTVYESFKDHWGFVEAPFEQFLARWLHGLCHDEHHDLSLWFLAQAGGQVVGTALCRSQIFYDPEMGWVGSLGVLRPWRRHGLGLALLQHSFAELHRRGKRKVGLGVDAQSLTGATRLYEKAGMRSDPQRQYMIFEKELRPGLDLARQSL